MLGFSALTVRLGPVKGGDTICFPLFPLFWSVSLGQSVTMTLLGQEVCYVPIVVPQSVVSLYAGQQRLEGMVGRFLCWGKTVEESLKRFVVRAQLGVDAEQRTVAGLFPSSTCCQALLGRDHQRGKNFMLDHI